MSPQTSINSLCSTSASSLSTLHHDDVILKQREQNSYTTESDIEEKKPQGALVEAIGGRFQKRLEGTRLCPSIHGIQSLSSDDLAPSYPFILGVGTFAQVTRVVLKLGNDATKNSYNKRYACKQLKQNLQSNPNEFVKSATELAYEAFILSCFDHPNIIKLRGLSEDGISSFGSDTAKGEEEDHRVASACVGSPPSSSFFLIMDVLEETLDQRIERWKTIARPRSLTETRQRAIEKLSLCQQLANVLEYIHSKGVVYRDLKPQNIGFSEKEGGILKLFDFGLSRELPDSIADASSATFGKEKPTNPNEHVRFKLSGVVGTIRYMAPEVCLSQPYNRDCDIYSWSIVAWEIWSESKPFEEFTPELYEDLVCKQGFRPTDDESAKRIPYELECLLKEAWKLEPHQRIRWPAIQRRLAVFQKCEELSLRESMRAEAAASIPATIAINGRHSMGMMNFPLFHTSIHGLLGGVDVAVNSPCTNSNIIGCSAFSAGSHSITDKNFIFGGSPLRMIGPIRSMPIVLRTGDQDIRSTAKWNHCFNHPPQLS
jgi:serine/threonine protein kinase